MTQTDQEIAGSERFFPQPARACLIMARFTLEGRCCRHRQLDGKQICCMTSLWCYPNPPQNSADDLPRMSGAERNSFVLIVLWLENIGMVVAPETRYGQALISVPGDDDFPMEFAHISVGRIDGNYKSILN
jgi:hypothetical protein